MIDLSRPDNSELDRGRSFLVEAAWWFLGLPLLRNSVIPSSSFRSALLRLFGARVGKGVLLKPGIRVKFPWYLSIGDHCWIGEDVWIDNLAEVMIESHVTISQGAYLCTGNHDWTHPHMKLFRRPIVLRSGSWVGARCVICPGTTLAEGAIAAAGSVIAKSIPSFEIHAGNPAQFVRTRVMTGAVTPGVQQSA